VTTRPSVSVIIPHHLRSSAGDLTAVARQAEDAGLDGVFVGDHLTPAVPVTDSTLALTVAAAATSRVRLGFGVLVLGLRHPAWAARQLATLQQLSGNRVILGVGLGGSAHGQTAWRAVGVPVRERGARTDETLGLLRDLIRGEPTVLPNGTELTLAPGAPAPPVWIGGNTAGARRRAARYGDAWFPSMITPAELASGLAHLAGLCAEAGAAKVPAAAVGGSVLLGPSLPDGALDAHVAALAGAYRIPAGTARQLPLRGSPAAVAERLRSYADAGARHIVLGLVAGDWREQLGLLAEAVRLT
jgi:alkanesulfonate monooxygenase SsuD/methylene tetrahydromethanopterin reductase-like flavin-dependent oxidoreductase (luciferase family)